MSNEWSDDASGFDAHLRALNARRLRSASWSFAAVILLTLAANLVVPSLRLWPHAVVQIAVAVYFAALGLIARSPKAMDWPTPALPLLFGLGAAATGLVFNLDLAPRIGANPAYSTVMVVACLAPIWPERLLLLMLVPVHLVYLASVFSEQQPPTFVLVMSVGGTVAVVLGLVRRHAAASRRAAGLCRRRRHPPPEGRARRCPVAGQRPARGAARDRGDRRARAAEPARGHARAAAHGERRLAGGRAEIAGSLARLRGDARHHRAPDRCACGGGRRGQARGRGP